MADSGVAAGSYGSTTAVPVLGIDSKGRVTSVSTATIATSFDITDGSTTDTVAGGEALTFAGVANETTATVSDNTVTVGLVTNPTIGGNLTVSGDLTVAGTTTQVNTTNMAVEDSLVEYATGNTSDAIDIGFFGRYDNAGTTEYTGIFRDANDGKFKFFTGNEAAPTTTVDTTGTGYSVASIVANIEGDVTGTVSDISNHSTDTLSEGSTNLYYTTARQNADFDTRLADATIDGGTY